MKDLIFPQASCLFAAVEAESHSNMGRSNAAKSKSKTKENSPAEEADPNPKQERRKRTKQPSNSGKKGDEEISSGKEQKKKLSRSKTSQKQEESDHHEKDPGTLKEIETNSALRDKESRKRESSKLPLSPLARIIPMFGKKRRSMQNSDSQATESQHSQGNGESTDTGKEARVDSVGSVEEKAGDEFLESEKIGSETKGAKFPTQGSAAIIHSIKEQTNTNTTEDFVEKKPSTLATAYSEEKPIIEASYDERQDDCIAELEDEMESEPKNMSLSDEIEPQIKDCDDPPKERKVAIQPYVDADDNEAKALVGCSNKQDVVESLNPKHSCVLSDTTGKPHSSTEHRYGEHIPDQSFGTGSDMGQASGEQEESNQPIIDDTRQCEDVIEEHGCPQKIDDVYTAWRLNKGTSDSEKVDDLQGGRVMSKRIESQDTEVTKTSLDDSDLQKSHLGHEDGSLSQSTLEEVPNAIMKTYQQEEAKAPSESVAAETVIKLPIFTACNTPNTEMSPHDEPRPRNSAETGGYSIKAEGLNSAKPSGMKEQTDGRIIDGEHEKLQQCSTSTEDMNSLRRDSEPVCDSKHLCNSILNEDKPEKTIQREPEPCQDSMYGLTQGFDVSTQNENSSSPPGLEACDDSGRDCPPGGDPLDDDMMDLTDSQMKELDQQCSGMNNQLAFPISTGVSPKMVGDELENKMTYNVGVQTATNVHDTEDSSSIVQAMIKDLKQLNCVVLDIKRQMDNFRRQRCQQSTSSSSSVYQQQWNNYSRTWKKPLYKK